MSLWRQALTQEGRVGRAPYAGLGFGLAIFKYLAEVAFLYATQGVIWTPLAYVVPSWILRDPALRGLPEWGLLLVGLWTLPFLWIGINMTRKRALDAGLSGWSALLFLVPMVNYAVMIALCFVPSRSPANAGTGVQPSLTRTGGSAPAPHPLAVATMAALLGIAAGGVVLFASVYGFGSYGGALFLGAPFLQGVVTGVILQRHGDVSLRHAVLVACLSVFVAAGALLLLAVEGLICIAMAMPLAMPLAMLGAFFGYAVAFSHRAATSTAAMLMIALPGAAGIEARRAPEPFEVVSSVVIDAPPERVWPRVVSFSELPPPHELLFRSGVAYPMRARIEGHGVGAIRYCEFSTGPFVEPITRWEAPSRLSFDVVAQPRPMSEWSPYRGVAPPHLEGYFRSRRGEFRLVDLGDGRTRLEGSTWYELRLYPARYWRLWADATIHAIHTRVLEHIAVNAGL